MPLYDSVRDLKLSVERVELEHLDLTLKHMTRRTTVVHLHGAGHEGVGEDVSYEEDLQLAFTEDALPDLDRRAHARLLLGPRRRPAELPALGARVGGARPRPAPERPLAGRSSRPRAASRPLRRLPERRRRLARRLPRNPLQARRRRLLDRRGRGRARRHRRRRRRRPEGPLRGRLGRRHPLRRALRPRRAARFRTPGSRIRA